MFYQVYNQYCFCSDRQGGQLSLAAAQLAGRQKKYQLSKKVSAVNESFTTHKTWVSIADKIKLLKLSGTPKATEGIPWWTDVINSLTELLPFDSDKSCSSIKHRVKLLREIPFNYLFWYYIFALFVARLTLLQNLR